jgi:hypothetical protein
LNEPAGSEVESEGSNLGSANEPSDVTRCLNVAAKIHVESDERVANAKADDARCRVTSVSLRAEFSPELWE